MYIRLFYKTKFKQSLVRMPIFSLNNSINFKIYFSEKQRLRPTRLDFGPKNSIRAQDISLM